MSQPHTAPDGGVAPVSHRVMNLAEFLAQAARRHPARIAVSEAHFRADLDADQFAFELYSIMLGAHLFIRFLHAPRALARTTDAFERLVASARRSP